MHYQLTDCTSTMYKLLESKRQTLTYQGCNMTVWYTILGVFLPATISVITLIVYYYTSYTGNYKQQCMLVHCIQPVHIHKHRKKQDYNSDCLTACWTSFTIVCYSDQKYNKHCRQELTFSQERNRLSSLYHPQQHKRAATFTSTILYPHILQ